MYVGPTMFVVFSLPPMVPERVSVDTEPKVVRCGGA
jgi:hypothetical protein